MKTMVVYTSKYGSAEKYARWIAEDLGCPAKRLQDVKSGELSACDTLIYGGGLYAGGVAGLKKFLARLDPDSKQRLALFLVGMTDPAEKEVYAKIAEDNLPGPWRERFQVFALRGDQLFSKMSAMHRLMMRLPKALAEKKPPGERSEQDRAFIESYGEDICFSSRDQIAPLVDSLSHG